MKNVCVAMLVLMLGGCCASPFSRSSRGVDAEAEYRQLEQRVTAYLQLLEEPIMEPPYDETFEMYRFVWRRTFHHPIVIRIVRSDDQITLIGKQFTGAGGYEHGELDLRIERTVTPEQWTNFQYLLSTTAFWEMPSVEPEKRMPDGNIIIMLDGASWMLEGIHHGRWHIVYRRFMMDYPDFQQACLYLLTLSEIPVPPEEIY